MPPRDLTLSVVRPEDLLYLVLEFEGVEVTEPLTGQAGEIAGAASARLTVHFQAQHIGEQSFWLAAEDHQEPVPSDEPPLSPGSVRARLAGPSRLVFDVPSSEVIPLTLAGILEALTRLPLRVSAVNRWEPPGCLNPARWGQQPPRVTPPGADETALELPYRLIVSPDDTATWAHTAEPVERAGWTELWHTRLGSSRRNADPRVRAIWSPDFRAASIQPLADVETDPFRMSLNARDRNQIVHLTSNYHIAGFTPVPVETELFMLSTLGGWLKVERDWGEPPTLGEGQSLSMTEWRHEAIMARDQYVKVVDWGYLCPCRHLAFRVTVTERKLLYKQDPPHNVAYLYTRTFIVVKEPVKTYSPRDMAFRKIRIKTEKTPNLVHPGAGIAGWGLQAFWPQIDTGAGAQDFQFHLVGTDWAGNEIEWTAPLIWLDKQVHDGPGIDDVLTDYNTTHPVEHARRNRPFAGQGIAFAPSKKASDTTFETLKLSHEAIKLGSGSAPLFRPAMKQADVEVPAVKQLLGTGAGSKIEWESSYLSGSGTSIGNKGDIFVKLIGETPLAFATDKAGGMVGPDIGISGLSRSLGPVGKADQMVGGAFNPQEIFGDAVKLLGGISLWEIVMDLVFNAASTTADKIPGLTTERVGDAIHTKYTWKLASSELVQDHTLFHPKGSSAFSLEALVVAPLDGTAPTSSITGSLTDFSVTLLPTPDALRLVEITFDSVTFKSEQDKKADVQVQLGGIDFTGILEFVMELRDHIPMDGFGDGPTLEIAPSGVNVGFTFGIPTIGVGILTIQNISLSAGFFLPFGDDDLNFHFAFCERQQPFILTVSLFGGGGFFSIDIGMKGVKMIEAALEFGAAASINLGVASGEASMMAGFYFQLAGSSFELTGYFRAYGSLSVLGIITVSLEFYLALTFENKATPADRSRLWGQASLKVKIEILFFSVSVSVSMQKEFAGSDPKFREIVAHSDWQEYVDAFAAYPA